MDHSYISENNIADLYLMGRLGFEDTVSFEAHAENCQECLDLMNEVMFVRQALLSAGPPASVRGMVFRPKGLAAWLARFEPRRQVAVLAAALLLLVCLPVSILLLQVAHLHGQLRQEILLRSLATSNPSEAIGNGARPPEAGTTGQDMPDSPRDLNSPRKTHTQEASEGMEARGSRKAHPLAPQGNTPVFVLSSLRKITSPEHNERGNIVSLPRGANLFVISLELEGSKQYSSYSVEVLGKAKTHVWGAGDLKPDGNAVLSIVFPRRYLKTGDYRLVLAGSGADGGAETIAEYLFSFERLK